ncbi:hypothetical protein [Niveispirillum cyanobacteriorum]|uniref:Uncharacterized protein n=1 Tax=Niveispirillum cyanobacteriorum TaxID=1612173 RepID=A0A2K9N909_9PROT|nr:hypothetical protein [Niveispirillum cyanobacteriorum]AUN29641.1 hypothetical protein C0V82_04930 [Niveispirillum cyanobacteriorum]GGE62406.1 hypothetical protein GCM10011317_19870 [Niveispirillum cyanobacteriorum]
METGNFHRFASLLRDISLPELEEEIRLPRRLLLSSGTAGRKRIDVAYAPFDHVNLQARIVIVGLTPGRQQMGNALREARRVLQAGGSHEEAMAKAKSFASFSGPMRSNLVAMLDSVGVNAALRIPSTASLWDRDVGLVHFTSALRNPVFVDGGNYSGNPSMLAVPQLKRQLETGLGNELASLTGAMVVPLGPRVTEAVEHLARIGAVNQDLVLSGMPHPSGANGERIAFFLGRKPQELLSRKVEPKRLELARASLLQKVGEYR